MKSERNTFTIDPIVVTQNHKCEPHGGFRGKVIRIHLMRITNDALSLKPHG